MDWLYIFGGVLVLLWGVWLFADFVVGWLLGGIKHD